VSGAPLLVAYTVRIARAGDAPAVRTLTCAGRKPSYAGTAQKLIRRCGSVLAGDVLAPPGFRCLLFRNATAPADAGLVGVSAIATAEGGICDWIVMGVARPLHGARVVDGRSLAAAIADETARFAQGAGYERMVAQVHRGHRKSLHIIDRLGFARVASLAADYDLYAVDLAVGMRPMG
jgi:hypothetical protein